MRGGRALIGNGEFRHVATLAFRLWLKTRVALSTECREGRNPDDNQGPEDRTLARDDEDLSTDDQS